MLDLDTTITEAMLDAAYSADPTDYGVIFDSIVHQLAQDDLDEQGAGTITPATPPQAIANARGLHDQSTYVGVGYCLRTVRDPEFRIPGLYPDAETAWEEAELKHRTSNPMEIPRGGIPFWTNGRFGHVALGVGGGMCWTTDYRRPGYVDLAPIAALGSWCGGKLVGWAEDLNGVDCWPNDRGHKPVFNIDDRIRIVTRVLARARANDAGQVRIDGLENWLDRLEKRAAAK